MAEEFSAKLTFSFLLLISSFPILDNPHYYYLCNLSFCYNFLYLSRLRDIFRVLSFLYFLSCHSQKNCVKNPKDLWKFYKSIRNQIIYSYYSITVLFIIIFKLRKTKEKGVPMSSIKSLYLFSLVRCFPTNIVIASIIIVLLVKKDKHKTKNKNSRNINIYSIFNLAYCFSCYIPFSYAWYSNRMQNYTLIQDTHLNIYVLKNNKKYLSPVNLISICLTTFLLLMNFIYNLFQFICQNSYFTISFSMNNYGKSINRFKVSINKFAETSFNYIVASIQNHIHKCDRFEKYFNRFSMNRLFASFKLKTYILYLCQLLLRSYKINLKNVYLRQNYKHLEKIIQALFIRSFNQRKLPIANYPISFILNNSS